jgi:hypothetical protein
MQSEGLNEEHYFGFITHFNSLDCIYITHESQNRTLIDLDKLIRLDTESLKSLTNFEDGNLCLARSPTFKSYYFGKIISYDATNEKCIIHFIHYGNDETVKCKHLKCAPPYLLEYLFAEQIILNEYSLISGWIDQNLVKFILEILKELVDNYILIEIKVLNYSITKKKKEIEIFFNGKSIKQMALEKSLENEGYDSHCIICVSHLDKAEILTPCRHIICSICFSKLSSLEGITPTCPVCRCKIENKISLY